MRGLRLLFVCLFLGIATLAAIGSLTAAITDELAARGQAILGGDVEVAMTQREATEPRESAFPRRRAGERDDPDAGDGAPIAPRRQRRCLTELKAVDGAYPLYGTLTRRTAAPCASRLAADRS